LRNIGDDFHNKEFQINMGGDVGDQQIGLYIILHDR
jgi:hypothetical protein